jgi:hypothetical protein
VQLSYRDLEELVLVSGNLHAFAFEAVSGGFFSPEQIDSDVAQNGKALRAIALPGATVVLTKDYVQDSLYLVFDAATTRTACNNRQASLSRQEMK